MTRSKARATAARDAKGRAIYRGAQGGHFIMKNGKRRYMTAERLRAAQRALAEQLARKVTGNAVVALAAAAAMKAARRPPLVGPKGLGLRTNLYARNATEANGYAQDPVSLERIPTARAVKVGMQTFDTKTLRELFRRNPNEKHPVTRQPFPPAIRAKYGPGSKNNVYRRWRNMTREQQFILRLTYGLARTLRTYDTWAVPMKSVWWASLAILYHLYTRNINNNARRAVINRIQIGYGVEIVETTHLGRSIFKIRRDDVEAVLSFPGTIHIDITTDSYRRFGYLTQAKIYNWEIEDALRGL